MIQRDTAYVNKNNTNPIYILKILDNGIILFLGYSDKYDYYKFGTCTNEEFIQDGYHYEDWAESFFDFNIIDEDKLLHHE